MSALTKSETTTPYEFFENAFPPTADDPNVNLKIPGSSLSTSPKTQSIRTDINVANDSSSAIGSKEQILFKPETFAKKIVKNEKEIQWWLGEVIEVKKDSFVGKLRDLNGRLSIAEFSKSVTPAYSQRYIQVDASFTYSVTAKESFTGSTEYSTKLNFLAKQVWKLEYEKQVNDVLSAYLPKNFLDL